MKVVQNHGLLAQAQHLKYEIATLQYNDNSARFLHKLMRRWAYDWTIQRKWRWTKRIRNRIHERSQHI